MTPGLDTHGNQQPWLHKYFLLAQHASQISYDDDQKSGASSALNCLPVTVGAWSANSTQGLASRDSFVCLKKITATSQTCGSSRYSSYQNSAGMASGRGVSKESTSYSQGPLVRAECAPFTYTLLMAFRHSPRVLNQ
jgi:hypothetical protein